MKPLFCAVLMKIWTISFLVLLQCGCASAAEQPGTRVPYVFQPGHIDLERGPDGNTEIIDAPDGLIVVDTGRHPEHVQAIIDYAQAKGKPVAAILNTHWHLDHTTGNRDLRLVFPGAKVIGTNAGSNALSGFLAKGIEQTKRIMDDPASTAEQRAAAVRRYAAVTDLDSFLPATPVTSSGMVEIAGRAMELHVAHAAATEDDMWIVVPDENLAIVGDLVVGPAPFFDTACAEGWTAALDEIGAAHWSILVPGHGQPMDRAAFERWHVAFDHFLTCGLSSDPTAACVAGWMVDAKDFYSAAESESVSLLIQYYVDDVLRGPPERRMEYCEQSE